METPLDAALRADPEKELEENAAADPRVAVRQANESFMFAM